MTTSADAVSSHGGARGHQTPGHDAALAALAELRLLVGSYTATGGGHATGISVVEPGGAEDHDLTASGGLVARTVAIVDDPSFLAVAGDRVYVVSEVEDGFAHAFRRRGGGLEYRWTAPSGGDAPCHVSLHPAGALVVANYTSGTVTAVAIASADRHASDALDDGGCREHGAEMRSDAPAAAVTTDFLPDVVGPVEDRQEGPHAHQSIPGPDGMVLVADLGGDAIHEYRLTVDAGTPTLERLRAHRVHPGVGPRHMAWFGDDLLVSGELDGRVHRLRRDEQGELRPVESAGTSLAAAEGETLAIEDAATVTGSTGESYLSHIVVTDAGLVYVAVRGRDTIAVLDANGPLTLLAEVDCGGIWPRHFALVAAEGGDAPVGTASGARRAGLLLVANERSDAIAVLPLDADGIPGPPIAQIPVGTPTCIVPVR